MKSVISIDQLKYIIPYSQTILDNVTFEVQKGDFLGLLGHNGTGKTTLIDILLGIKKPSKGEVKVLGENPHSENRIQKHKIAFLSQDVSLKGNLSIEEFIQFQRVFYPDFSQTEYQRLLSVFGLDPMTKIGALSTGQQKKVQIIAGLSSSPELIIIDEITAVLDPETRDIFFNELQKIKSQKGTAIILATNIAEDLMGRADRVLFIQNKEVQFHNPEEIEKLFNIGQVA
jgi:ABC-2 type transport system ATP-binding protein